MDITVLCPSRGNAQALFEAAFSFMATRTNDSLFVPVVDENDPAIHDYFALNEDVGLPIEVVPGVLTGNMNNALNYAAIKLADQSDIIGFVGDDHRFRTKSWDRVISKVLDDEGGGFLYGNDLAQGEALPTQVFISSSIIRALGWMGLPGAHHLYLDNTWKMLGDRADCLFYLPDIVIEHMHPAFGKGEWDENHRRVNAPAIFDHDRLVYEIWLRDGCEADVQRVRDALR